MQKYFLRNPDIPNVYNYRFSLLLTPEVEKYEQPTVRMTFQRQQPYNMKFLGLCDVENHTKR